jgi:hypothetical protein
MAHQPWPRPQLQLELEHHSPLSRPSSRDLGACYVYYLERPDTLLGVCSSSIQRSVQHSTRSLQTLGFRKQKSALKTKAELSRGLKRIYILWNLAVVAQRLRVGSKPLGMSRYANVRLLLFQGLDWRGLFDLGSLRGFKPLNYLKKNCRARLYKVSTPLLQHTVCGIPFCRPFSFNSLWGVWRY